MNKASGLGSSPGRRATSQQDDKCYWRRGRTSPQRSHVACSVGAFSICPYAEHRLVCAGDPRERL